MNIVKIEPIYKALVQNVESVDKIGTSETTGVDGVNKSFKITLDDGKSYLWKSRNGEHISSWRYIPAKTLYNREKAAYIVDRKLGFNMVPLVKVVTYKGDIGSLQRWVEDTSPSDATLKSYSDDDIWKAGLFDLIIGNCDRHSGNWLHKLGRPILIDHGFAFPNYAAEGDNKSLILSRFAVAIWDKHIPDLYLAKIDRLTDDNVITLLKKYLDTDSLKLMYERIGIMLKTRKAAFPKYKVIKKLDKVPKNIIKSIETLLKKAI